MKKVQLLALSMLLSTGYMTQTTDFKTIKNNTEKNQSRRDNKGMKRDNKGMKNSNRAEIEAEALAAIGGNLDYPSVISYANQTNTALAKLSASSTTDDVKAVQKMLRNIRINLRALNPKAVVDESQQ